jgi:hypothetical protein
MLMRYKMGIADTIFSTTTLFIVFIIALGALGASLVISMQARTQLANGNTAQAKIYVDRAAIIAGVTWGVLFLGLVVFVITSYKRWKEEKRRTLFDKGAAISTKCGEVISAEMRGKGYDLNVSKNRDTLLDSTNACRDSVMSGMPYTFSIPASGAPPPLGAAVSTATGVTISPAAADLPQPSRWAGVGEKLTGLAGGLAGGRAGGPGGGRGGPGGTGY